ncbi:MAG: PilN domain-containing protein [Deltaproteobacteria bacterium]|nr:PilN domain-containing protein [Deltaproteobacteria bacterium]MBK9367883.1 PilN domain-containing protein [Deltaproteobacteria bacterium]
MIKINLLPVRISKKVEALKQELIYAAVAVAAVILLCLVAGIYQAATVSDAKARLAALEKEITALKADADRVDEIAKIREDLSAKLAVIGDLKKSQSGPVHLLDELAEAAPEAVSLTQLSEVRGKLELKGIAQSNEVVSQFLTNMERSDWLDQVYLVGIDSVEKDGKKYKTFEITAQVSPPKTAAEIVAEEKKAKAEAAKAEKDAKAKAKAPAAPAPAAAGGDE